MTRELTILAFFLISSFSSCGQTKTSSKKLEMHSDTNQIDTSVFAVLPWDSSLYWIFKTGKSTELTSKDILQIESILIKCINEYNLKQESQFKEINDKHPEYKMDENYFVIDLIRYKRQYVSIINNNGEKEVWINCFCLEWDKLSRTSLVIVRDGGNCFFNLKINLTTGKYYDLEVNGEA